MVILKSSLRMIIKDLSV